MNKLTSVLTAGVFALGLAFAQHHDGAPPNPSQMAQKRVEYLTTVLSLTSTQQTQATAIFTSAATTSQANHASMKAAHDSLKTATEANDGAAIEAAATTIGNLTAQDIASHAKAQASFFQILTPEQQTKFKTLESQHHGGPGMGPMGFGGRH